MMVSDREMVELLEWSLENPDSDQMEICFWEIVDDQLVFA